MPATKGTRPAIDRVREAVFSSTGEWVVGADVADLYAGSGSFGLEALSRGAASAVFVERSRKALAALEDNIATVGLGGIIVRGKVGAFLQSSNQAFHLVFMDPPWEQPTSVMESEMALLDRLLGADAEVVVSRRHSDQIPQAPETWRVAANKRYGDTRILRYSKPESEG